jgi:hypothetical protein
MLNKVKDRSGSRVDDAESVSAAEELAEREAAREVEDRHSILSDSSHPVDSPSVVRKQLPLLPSNSISNSPALERRKLANGRPQSTSNSSSGSIPLLGNTNNTSHTGGASTASTVGAGNTNLGYFFKNTFLSIKLFRSCRSRGWSRVRNAQGAEIARRIPLSLRCARHRGEPFVLRADGTTTRE